MTDWSTAWGDIPTSPALLAEDFRTAVEVIMDETLQPRSYPPMHPREWEWYQWAMKELGVSSIDEVWSAIAAEDRFLRYMLSIGWRP